MKNKSSYKVIERYRTRINPENNRFVSKNLQISNQISELLTKKGLTQKEFATMLGKQESEVSKWLSGLHNLTLKSITKMEAVLNEDILITPIEACATFTKIKYVTLHVSATRNQLSRDVSQNPVTKADYNSSIEEDAA